MVGACLGARPSRRPPSCATLSAASGGRYLATGSPSKQYIVLRVPGRYRIAERDAPARSQAKWMRTIITVSTIVFRAASASAEPSGSLVPAKTAAIAR